MKHYCFFRRFFTILISFLLITALFVPVNATAAPTEGSDGDFGLDCLSAVLMEESTGRILYEKNADEALSPASVTKIMTLLLVMEALDNGVFSYDTMLTASTHASKMGGSQIYLKEGEQMCVADLIKSVVVSSANDAAVVLAEAVSGSEQAFVSKMNERASELGMNNSHFENTNGLDDTVKNHVMSARDIAIASRELMKHKKILEYSSIWMDTIRDGAFGLTNTNRLIRFYRGATGLKTGSTSKAKFCMSATAERDGMSLIVVIMAAPTRDARNSAAASLLDWGFATFSLYRFVAGEDAEIKVLGGKENSVKNRHGEFCTVLKKELVKQVKTEVVLSESLAAPVKEGEKTGSICFYLNGNNIGSVDVVATHSVEKISFGELFIKMLCRFMLA